MSASSRSSAGLLDVPKKSGRRSTRILIVDDSVVVRRLLTHALTEDAEFEVVGAASSAELALQKIPQLEPDVLILDLHLPGMSGKELLPILRERFRHLCVLIFSSSGEAECIDALMAGATDYLAKPSADASLGESIGGLRQQLAHKVKQLHRGRSGMGSLMASSIGNSSLGSIRLAPRPHRIERQVLAIGVSTGGPTALAKVIEGLPHNYPLPIVVVQHMPPTFTALLANRIRSTTGFDIVEAKDGMRLEPGRAILAPGDYHMRLARSGTDVVVRMDQGPHECSCRPSVDVLFRSVREVYGGAVIASILTGMGQDGLRGSQELTRAGAYLVAQDEATSVVWGMPGAVVQAGLANEVLPLNNIAAALVQQALRRQ